MGEIQNVDNRTQVPQTQDASTIMQVISRAASDPAVDIGKLERLMDMYERIEGKKAEQEFHAAMARMQVEMPEISERGEIKHNNKLISKYAKWEDVNRAIKPVLHTHGFALTFRVETTDKVTVSGVLSHSAGHCERTSITLPADTSGSKNPVQAVASSVSYGKRYVAGALLNLTSGEMDDDGMAAGGALPRITAEQAANIHALMEEVQANTSAFMRYWKIDSVEDIPAQAYKDVVASLERKRRKG